MFKGRLVLVLAVAATALCSAAANAASPSYPSISKVLIETDLRVAAQYDVFIFGTGFTAPANAAVAAPAGGMDFSNESLWFWDTKTTTTGTAQGAWRFGDEDPPASAIGIYNVVSTPTLVSFSLVPAQYSLDANDLYQVSVDGWNCGGKISLIKKSSVGACAVTPTA